MTLSSSGGAFRLPVGDDDFVGPFGLGDEFFLLVAELLDEVVVTGPGDGTGVGGGSGGELELASLVRGETGPTEGVVLAPGDQMPAQDRQFPGDGDGGDLKAPALFDSPIERSQ